MCISFTMKENDRITSLSWALLRTLASWNLVSCQQQQICQHYQRSSAGENSRLPQRHCLLPAARSSSTKRVKSGFRVLTIFPHMKSTSLHFPLPLVYMQDAVVELYICLQASCQNKCFHFGIFFICFMLPLVQNPDWCVSESSGNKRVTEVAETT